MKHIISKLVSVVFMVVAFAQPCFGQDVTYTVNAGSTVRLHGTADGTEPFTFRWFKDGVLVEGVSGPVFVIGPVTKNDSAAYSMEVSNSLGSAHSNKVICRVVVLPREAVDTYEVVSMWKALRKDLALASLPKCLKSEGGQI